MLDLTKRFKVNETRQVPDPFGTGTTWTIRHSGCKEYRDWLEGRENPVAKAMQSVGMRAAMVAQAKLAGSRASREDVERVTQEEVARLLENVEIGEGGAKRAAPDGVALLVERVDGLTAGGKKVASSADAVLEVLTDASPLPTDIVLQPVEGGGSAEVAPDTPKVDGELYVRAGTTVGEFFCLWVLWEAGRLDLYRTQDKEALKGN